MEETRPTGPISRTLDRLSHFFHAEEVPYGLAIVRIILPLTMLLPMLQRFPWARELYSAEGATCQLSLVYGMGDWLPEFPGSVVVALFSLMVFCLLCSSVGWMTRWSLIGATALFTYFNMLDAVSSITKYSVIAIDAMLVMCLANSGEVWSVDHWLRSKRAGHPISPRRSPVWPARLICLLLGCVYFGAAITKIQTQAFFSGDQMRFWMLTNVNFENPVGEYLAMIPAVLILSAYVTIVWEMCFLFTVWTGWRRPVVLALGITFHIGTWLMLGLYIFPLVCMSLYFAFLRQEDVRQISIWLRNRRRRGTVMTNTPAAAEPGRVAAFLSQYPQATYAVLGCLVVLAAVELEHRSNPYVQASLNGPPPLEELNRDVARKMIRAAEPIREQDKFFCFDIGTFSIGGILANSRNTFSYGDVVLAQSSLNPPHEDMLVECDVVDDQNRVIHHFHTVATREMLRCDFYYQMGLELDPGNYAFVLRSSGKEISRRPFRLVSNQAAAILAN